MDMTVIKFLKIKEPLIMGITEKVKEIDKMSSKYFIPFTIVVLGLSLDGHITGGGTIFSSLMQDISLYSLFL